MKNLSILIIAALVGFALTPAAAQSALKAGVLTCKMSVAVESQQKMRCRFAHYLDGPAHAYFGSLVGFSVGSGERGILSRWTVFAPTIPLQRGSLRGNYALIARKAPVEISSATRLIGVGQPKIWLEPLDFQKQLALKEKGTLELR
jgi:Protein of unknown function (DUF992)